jgi:hypothetical protein
MVYNDQPAEFIYQAGDHAEKQSCQLIIRSYLLLNGLLRQLCMK